MPEDPSVENISKCLLSLKSRSERLNQQQIVETFVNIGPLIDLISSDDHQVIYGRRGTGKTHALRYVSDRIVESGNKVIFLDTTQLGSDISIYNDTELSVEERATRLLSDVLAFLQDQFIHFALDGGEDLDRFTTLIDNFTAAIGEVRIVGETQTEQSGSIKSETEKSQRAQLTLDLGALATGLGGSSQRKTSEDHSETRVQRGDERLQIKFGRIGNALVNVVDFFAPQRIWLIVDEWSALPEAIQPFLADMLRRTFFNIRSFTVKIAAIEHRTDLKIDRERGQYIGLESAADIRANVNLDDFMVFENNEERATAFFADFLFRHCRSVAEESGFDAPENSDQFVSVAFTQRNVFKEFIKSTEGVPRDAIHIISIAAQKAFSKQIPMSVIRQAAHTFSQDDKMRSVDANETLSLLLKFIVEDVIKEKRTNAFLLEFGIRDKNIEALFDRRMIHLRGKNVSSRDNPGVRYLHYKIDYGSYIDLMATHSMPAEIDFGTDLADAYVGKIAVPEDDARSYRRAILDLDKFYRQL